ncbi:MAG: MBOAT family protein, partial [Clostridium sp.]|nr:MBOAT family protein [Clostridium sp.]
RNYGVSLIIAIIFSLPLVSMFYKKIDNFKWIKTIILMGIFIISVAYLVDATYNPFLYFRF